MCIRDRQSVVESVSGSDIDLEFRHTLGQIAVCSWIPVDQPIDTHQHAGTTREVFQPFQPRVERVRSLDSYPLNVARGLRFDKRYANV